MWHYDYVWQLDDTSNLLETLKVFGGNPPERWASGQFFNCENRYFRVDY